MLTEVQKITVNNKDLYIAGSHNRVLEAWEPGVCQNVFSLDYHTDTRPAFENYSYWRADSELTAGHCSDHDLRKVELSDQKIRHYLENRISMDQVNDNLRHDEHLDFAVRTGLIDKAFILSTNSNEKSSNPNVHIVGSLEEYGGQSLMEYSPPCVPGCRKENHDSDCSILRADSSIEGCFLDRAVRRANSLTAPSLKTISWILTAITSIRKKAFIPKTSVLSVP